MSDEGVAQILEAIGPIKEEVTQLRAENAQLTQKVDDLEFIVKATNRVRPYYDFEEMQALTGKTTRQAIYSWCKRKGINTTGHNKWPRKDVDAAL